MKSTPRSKSGAASRKVTEAGQFESLFQNNPLPMWVYDLETLRFLEVNDAALKQYGYTRNEFMHMRISDIRPKEDIARLKAHLKAKHPGFRQSGEWRHCRKDGSLIDVEITSHKLTYDGHKAAWVLAKDITDRKQAEAALKENQAELAGVIDTAMDAIIIINENQRIVTFNSAAEKVFQRSTREVVGKPLSLLIPEPYKKKHRENVIEFGRAGTTRRSVGNLGHVAGLRADGSVFPIEVSISSFEINGEKHYTAIVRDITERQRVEDQIRNALNYANTVIETSPVGIITYDANGQAISANEAVTKIIGATLEQVMAQNFRHIESWKRYGLLEAAEKALATGCDQAIETPFVSTFGKSCWLYCRFIPFQYERESRLLVLVTDIAESKRVEVQIRQRNEDLSLLDAINDAVNRGLSLDAILELISKEAEKTFNSFIVTLHLLSSDHQRLALQNFSIPSKLMRQIEKLIGVSIPRELEHDLDYPPGLRLSLKVRKALLVSKPDEFANLFAAYAKPMMLGNETINQIRKLTPIVLKVLDLKSLARVPLVIGPEVVGTLDVASHELIDEQSLRRLESIAGHLTTAIQRRQTEEALQESEERFRSLYENSTLGLYRTTPDGQILLANPALVQMLGYASFEELAHLNLEKGGHNTSYPRQKFKDQIERDGEVHGLEATWRRKDGTSIFLRESARVIRDPHGGTLYYEGTVEDITERKQAEEAGRESEKQYRSLFENMLEGFAYCKMLFEDNVPQDFIYLDVNGAFEKLTGLHDVIGKKVTEVIPGIRETNPELFEVYSRVAMTGQAERLETYVEGLHIWFSISVYSYQKGYFIAVFDNITERKNAANALEASEAELRALIAALPDVVMVLDKEGRYLKVAATSPNLQKLQPEDVLGKSMHDIFSRQKADRFVKYIRRALRTHKPVWFEYALLIGDQIAWFSGATAPLTNDTVVWVARDITPQKHAEEQIKRRLLELETLYESGLAFSRTLDIHAIGRQIIHVLHAHLSWHHAAVRLSKEDSDEVELLAFSGGSHKRSREHAQASITRKGEGLSGWVIEHGEGVRAGELREDARYAETFPGMRSGMYMPMKIGEQTIGCISVESQQPQAFDENDERLLTTLAAQAAAAIQNIRLFEQTQRRAIESEMLYEITSELAVQHNLSTLLELMAERAARLFHVPGGTVYLYSQGQQELEAVATTHEGISVGTRIKLGEGLAGRVAQTQQPLIVDDYQTSPYRLPQFTDQPFTSILEVPMIYSGELVGVLVSFDLASQKPSVSGTGRKFGERDIRLLSLFASAAAGAVYSARLYQEAVHSAERWATLHAASQEIARVSQDLEAVYSSIHHAVAKLMSAEAFTIVLRDQRQQQLEGAYLFDRGGRSPSISIPYGQGFSSQIIAGGESILINDARENPAGAVHFGTSETTCSILAVPLRVGSKVIGAISAQSYQLNAYNQEHRLLLELLATQAAIAIENARLLEEAQRRAQQFETLYETTRDLSLHQRNLPSLLQTLVERAVNLLQAHGCGMYLFDPSRNDLELAVVSADQEGRGARVKLGEGAAGTVAQTRTPLIIDDYQNWEGRRSLLEGVPYRALVQVPMLYSGELIGVLDVYEYGDSERKFSEDDVQLLSHFAAQAAGAIHNARQFEQISRRVEELGALSQISSALRTATGRAEMLPIIIDHSRSALKAEDALFAAFDPVTNELLVERASGYVESLIGMHISLDAGLLGNMIRAGKPYISSDIRVSGLLGHLESAGNLRCAAAIPLIIEGEPIGLLAIAREERNNILPQPFSEREVSLLTAIGDMIANALRRDSLHEETVRYTEQLVVVNRLGRTLAESLDPEQVYSHLSQSTLDLLPNTESMYITLYDETTRSARVVYGIFKNEVIDVSGLPEIALKDQDHGALGQVIQTGEPLIVNDLRKFIRSKQSKPIPVETGPLQAVSALYIPMISDGKVSGIIQLQSNLTNRYTSSDAKLLSLIANTAAVAVQNARYFSQLQERVEQLSALHVIDATIGSTTDLRVSLQVMLDALVRLLRVDAAGVLVYSPVSLTLEYAGGVGFHNTEVGHAAVRLGESLAGRAALMRQPVEVLDLSTVELLKPFREMVNFERFVSYLCIPLITKGEIKGVLEIFHRSPLRVDKDWTSLVNLMAGQAAIAIENAMLFDNLQRANTDLEMAYDATIDGWSQALELRDHDTQGHTHRLLEMTLSLARKVGIPEIELPYVRRGVLLHDIGKMGVPDGILLKPGPLDEEEWKIMRQHPESAYKLLAPIAYLRSSLDIPYCHHEKWDGSGYPRGLAGEQIPLAARVFSVVDVYDALSYDRPYRSAWPKEKVIEYIKEQSGKHFDPQVVEAFLQII